MGGAGGRRELHKCLTFLVLLEDVNEDVAKATDDEAVLRNILRL